MVVVSCELDACTDEREDGTRQKWLLQNLNSSLVKNGRRKKASGLLQFVISDDDKATTCEWKQTINGTI